MRVDHLVNKLLKLQVPAQILLVLLLLEECESTCSLLLYLVVDLELILLRHLTLASLILSLALIAKLDLIVVPQFKCAFIINFAVWIIVVVVLPLLVVFYDTDVLVVFVFRVDWLVDVFESIKSLFSLLLLLLEFWVDYLLKVRL